MENQGAPENTVSPILPASSGEVSSVPTKPQAIEAQTPQNAFPQVPKVEAGPQPKPKARKGKRGKTGAKELSIKQLRYIEGRSVKGMSKADARRFAGFSELTSTKVIEESPTLKNALAHALVKRGVNVDFIAKKLAEGTGATEKRFFTADGVVTDEREVPDWSVREKYLRHVDEVMGFIRNNSIETLQIGLVAIPQQQSVDEWNHAKEAPLIPNAK